MAKVSGGAWWWNQGVSSSRRGSPDSEVDAIKAVQAGRTDLAVVPVRAFSLVGLRSFDALMAPMEIDSMSLQQQVLSSDIATDIVSGVDRPRPAEGSECFPDRCGSRRESPDRYARRKDFKGARIAFSASAVA